MKIRPIETERLFLRGFEKDDALFAIGIWNDAETGKYLPDPAMTEIGEAYLKTVQALGEDAECCYLIAVSKETGERIGTCSFMPSEGGDAFDIAYCVSGAFWNQGYATEMAKGMLDAFRVRGGKRATVRVNRENAASNRIAQKLGFRVVGEKVYKKRGTDRTFTDYLYELDLDCALKARS